MIHLTRLNKGDLIINADIIETVEATPDTIITLLTGKKMIVREHPDEIVERVIQYRQRSGGPYVRPIDPKIYTAPASGEDEQ